MKKSEIRDMIKEEMALSNEDIVESKVMKKSQLKEFINEQIKNLFELKYTESNGVRIWLSPDKNTLYMDNISDSKKDMSVEYLVKAFNVKYPDLEVMKGNPRKLTANGLVMLHNIGDQKIDEKELEKIFNKTIKK